MNGPAVYPRRRSESKKNVTMSNTEPPLREGKWLVRVEPSTRDVRRAEAAAQVRAKKKTARRQFLAGMGR